MKRLVQVPPHLILGRTKRREVECDKKMHLAVSFALQRERAEQSRVKGSLFLSLSLSEPIRASDIDVAFVSDGRRLAPTSLEGAGAGCARACRGLGGGGVSSSAVPAEETAIRARSRRARGAAGSDGGSSTRTKGHRGPPRAGRG